MSCLTLKYINTVYGNDGKDLENELELLMSSSALIFFSNENNA